ncbi:MAG: hypothetical protein HFI03_02300 [Lachnospiraceae bacterium]|jgi:hypothetical protein|nr:hypothetical protein [Lachnospiraceae bacterium]
MGIDFVAFAKMYQFYLWNGSSLGGNRHRWQILILSLHFLAAGAIVIRR